jgi:sugar lactone lactonase YvrE
MKSWKLIFLLLAEIFCNVVVVVAQPVITSQPTNQIVFGGSNVTFSVTVSGAGPFAYQWRFNGTNLSKNIVTTFAGGGTGGDGGPATGASLNWPYSVAMDVAGNVFIAESGGNKVRKVDTNGVITTIAGTGAAGFSGDGGLATNAVVNGPADMGVDGLGNIYISDAVNNRIRKVDKNGIISTVAGNGTAAFSGDGGLATNASLNFPSGIFVDVAGNVLFADYNNHRVRRIGQNGGITTVAGNGFASLSGDGGAATNASLNYPAGVAADNSGNVYIADYGNSRIRRVDTNGLIVTVAGNLPGIPGNYPGDGVAATNANLLDSVRVTLDTFGNFYINDVYDGLIRKVDTNGIITTPVTGLNRPYGMVADPSENLYIADANNNRIGKVALLGAPLYSVIQAAPANAGNYDVIISESSGSVTSSVVTLTVNVPAYISAQPQSHSVSVGSNATFGVTAGGTLPLNYQWAFGGLPLSGAVNSNYTFNVSSTNLAGNYSVIVSNNYGMATSSLAALTVLVIPPGIATQPASLTAPNGSNVTIGVVASGSPPFIYQWFFDGALMDGQTNFSLSLLSVATNQVGPYSVVVSSPYGSITSHIASLTVGWLPGITLQPTNQTLLAGSRTVLSANVSGVGPLSFQWQLNGTNLPNNLISSIAGNGTAGFAGDGGLAVTGKINGPYNIASDSQGNVYIADTANNRVRKVSINGTLTTVAGTGIASFSGDGGAATNARINSPDGVALDATGNLLIADTSNNRIRKVDTNGIITTIAGKSSAGFSGDGGTATNATLNGPFGVTMDGDGNLFIADTSNTRLRKVDTNGIITTVAGKSGSIFSGDGGAATNAGLSAYGLAVDSAGNVFVADRNNNRVRQVDSYGVITTIAGAGSSAFSGDGGAATNAGVSAYGVAIDNYGDLFIADRLNNRIRRVDPYGIITTIAGTNGAGFSSDGIPATNSLLSNPNGIALDGYGRYLVADTSNNRVRRFGQGPAVVIDLITPSDAGQYTLVINSRFGSVTSSVATLTVLSPPSFIKQPVNQSAGLGSNATFTVIAAGTAPLVYQWQRSGTNLLGQTNVNLNLEGVHWADAGDYGVIITNNYGSVTSVVAMLTVGVPPSIVGQSASQMVVAGTSLVLSVAVSGDGAFFYHWQFNGTNLPPIVTTVAGTNGLGYNGDGISATNARLNLPQGIAVDSAGNLYIADYNNNRVRKVDTNGTISTVAGSGSQGNAGNGGSATNATLYRPAALLFDNLGNLYIGEYGNGDVRKVDTNGIITRIAGTGTTGISGDGAQATATAFNTVAGLAFDGAGSLYVCENVHCRIRKIATNGIVSTVAGNTVGVTGGFSGDGGFATNAQLNTPNAILVYPDSSVLIADTGNNRVRKVDPNGVITTIVGNGGSNYTGENTVATNTSVVPYGLALDGSGNLYISDRVRAVRKLDTNGIMSTVAGKAGLGFSGDGGTATNALFNSSWSIAFDIAGNLFIADEGNNRVRKIHFTGDPVLALLNVGNLNSGSYSVVITSPFGSVTSSDISLTVLTAPVILGAPIIGTDGYAILNLSTTPNISSRIYMATNLMSPVQWTPIHTNSSGGNWQFTDTNTASAKFYRVSTP